MNQLKQANYGSEQRFFLQVSNVPEALQVLSFEACDYAIDSNDKWLVNVLHHTALPISALCGQMATLEISDGVNKQLLQRYVQAVVATDIKSDAFHYQFQLISPVQKLTTTAHYRTFINKTVAEIIAEVLKPLSALCSISVLTAQKDQLCQYEVQNGVSDFDFLQRLFAGLGLHYLLNADTLMVFDEFNQLANPLATIEYAPLSGTPRLTESVWDIQQSRVITASGPYDEYCATGDALNLIPGSLVQLKGHPDALFNQTYHVLACQYAGQQLAAASRAVHKGQSTIPLITKLRLIKVNDSIPPVKASVSALLPLTTAIVESNTDAACLDEQGFYHVRLPLDEHGYAKTQASISVPQVHPYGGQQTTYHHPLTDQSTVALGYLNNNVNQPVIIGATPSVKVNSVTNNANYTQHILRSNSGHEMCYDDHPEHRQIRFSSSENKSQLSMLANGDDSHINFHSEGDVNWYAKQDIVHQVAGRHTLLAKNHVITVKGLHSILTQNNSIDLQAGKEFNTNSAATTHLESSQSSTQVTSKKDSIITAKKDINFIAQQGDVNTHSEQDIQLISDQATLVHNKDASTPLTLQGGQSSLQCVNNNNIISANNITLNAQTINIQGNISAKNAAGSSSQQQQTGFKHLLEKADFDMVSMYLDDAEFLEKHAVDVALIAGSIPLEETGIGEAMDAEAVDDILGEEVDSLSSGGNKLAPEELQDKTRGEIRKLAEEKGFVPHGNKNHPDYPRKWKDPITNKRRLRLDRGHVDDHGQPYSEPSSAGVDHVHGYDEKGRKITDSGTGDSHFVTKGE